jgi:hypothetical protein
MPLLPLTGPSYQLVSRPASVQRTVNLMPVPLEPGNERMGWVLKDVPGLMEFEQCVLPSFTLAVEAPGGDPSTWNTVSQPLTAQNDVVYAFSNGDKTIEVTSGSLGQRVETVSTPARSTGRRYFELSFNGALDQFGFATGDIFEAGGTLDALSDPVGVLIQVAKDQQGPGYAWWFRSYGIMGGFRSSEYDAPYEVGGDFVLRSIPDLANDDRIGFDVDLDAGECLGIYLNGTQIIPAGISGDDLTAWNAFNSWPANQEAGMQCYHRANEGDQDMTLYATVADIDGPIPDGSMAWDGPAGDDYQFTLTEVAGEGPFTFAWDFDDGDTSALQNPTHEFEEPGDYEVTVTITNACGSQVLTETMEVA